MNPVSVFASTMISGTVVGLIEIFKLILIVVLNSIKKKNYMKLSLKISLKPGMNTVNSVTTSYFLEITGLTNI